jgi:hypothetical protein
MSFCRNAARGLVAVVWTVGAAWAANAPTPPDSFAWQATLAVPPGAPVARVALPAQALVRLQSPGAADVRVFNAAQEPVAFAVMGVAPEAAPVPVEYTRNYTAFSLRATPAALFDTRAEKLSLASLKLTAQLPPNTLVHFTLATSTDLQKWTPLAVKGPLFRFEGTDAPANDTLELQTPAALQGRYVRVGWLGHKGVKVTRMVGTVAQPATPAQRLTVALPPGVTDGGAAQVWPLNFATPVAALHLQTVRDNTLVPVRLMGRKDASQPWQTLGHTVVYRLNTDGQVRSNSPVLIHSQGVRWLRVEATSALVLPEGGLQATVEFNPVNLAFLTTGAAPFTLAAGRADTPPMAVAAGTLGAVMAADWVDLPEATLQQIRADALPSAPSWTARWLPEGVSLRTALLWGVLLLGVLVLAAVAYSLFQSTAQVRNPANTSVR